VDVIRERVAGMHVHKETVVACVRATSGNKAMRESDFCDDRRSPGPARVVELEPVHSRGDGGDRRTPWLKTMLVQCAWAAKRANASTTRPSSLPPQG
jgi:hypothetical protein